MPRVISHKPSRSGGVFLATPAYSGLSAPYTQSLFSSHQVLLENDIPCHLEILTENCHVDDGRNMLVRNFLESDCEQLVFLDTDLSWKANDLLKLVQSERDIVAGIYPLKSNNESYPVRLFHGEQYATDDGLLSVEGVPTGFLKIRRNVIESLAEKANSYKGLNEGSERLEIPIIFERTLEGSNRWGGDYTFCLKALADGFSIYIDPEMSFTHFGESEWSGRYGDYLRNYNNILNPRIIKAFDLLKTQRDEQIFIDLFEAWGNNFAASPGLLMTCFDLSIDGDGAIIECGAGLSTLIMGLSGREIYSLESDYQWYLKIKSYLDYFNMTNVNLIYSPIMDYGVYQWYDYAHKHKFNVDFTMALVDGPCRAIGREGFYNNFDISDMILIIDDSETEAHFADGRENMVLGGEERPFMVSMPAKQVSYG